MSKSRAFFPLLASALVLSATSSAAAKPPTETLEIKLVEDHGKTQDVRRYLVPLEGRVSDSRCKIKSSSRDGEYVDLEIECRELEVRTHRVFALKTPTVVAQVHGNSGSTVTHRVIVTRR